ncbi:TonB-dependent receptor P39 [Chitinophaga sp. MM2321]
MLLQGGLSAQGNITEQQTKGLTLSFRNAPVEKIFDAIEQQSSYRILYDKKLTGKAKPVSIEVKNAAAASVFKKIFAGQPFGYTLNGQRLIVQPHPNSKESKNQPIDFSLDSNKDSASQISGRVTYRGAPLPGASVKIEGSTIGTVTDENGRFKYLSGSRLNGFLIVSFVGFHSKRIKLPLELNETLEVELEQEEMKLEGHEVVSTGYQILPKERATGSFIFLDNTEYNREISTDVLSRLEGKVSGMAFDKRAADDRITIRGVSTLTYGISAPLIVVDNFPYNGDLNNINPNDVESITILKDAASASIWGARSANGVIVITTKKGQYNKPLTLSFASNLTISEKPDLNYFPQMTSSDFIDVEQELFNNGFQFSDTAKNNRPIFSPVYEILFKQRNGKLTHEAASQQIDELRNKDLRRDYSKYIYRNPLNQQNSIQISGGNNQIKYHFSGGYDRNLSRLKENDFDRITLQNNTTFRILKNMETVIGIAYTQSKSDNNSIGDYNSLSLSDARGTYIYPYAELGYGNTYNLPKNYRTAYLDTAGNGRLLNWNYNPLTEMQESDKSTKNQDFVLNLGNTYQLLPSLSVGIKYQFENQKTQYRSYYNTNTFFARDLINRFSQLKGSEVIYGIPLGGILDLDTRNLVSNNLRGQLNYDKVWNQKNRISAIAGMEISEANFQGNSFRTYGYNEENSTSQNVDFKNSYPVFDNLSGTTVVPNKADFSQVTNRYRSYFVNAAYTYKEKYIMSGSARKDESNLFGVETNKKGVPLWSSGLSWIISNEDFFKTKMISFLKLRSTFGYQGNINPTATSLATIRYYTPNRITNLIFAAPYTPPNSELRWEKVGTFNVGLDFSLKDDLITGSVEYYTKNSTDLLSPVPIDPTSGFNSVTMNAADIKGKGIDIQLTFKIIQTPNFKWRTSALYSSNKSVVAKYFNTSIRANSFLGNGFNLNPLEGKVLYPMFSYKWAGLDPKNGDPQGYLNGAVSKEYSSLMADSVQNLVYHGSAIPLYFGSIRNDINWKGFQLSVNITYKFKYFIRRPTIEYNSLYTQWKGHTDYKDRWQNPGDEATTSVPSMTYPANSNRDLFYANAEPNVEKGDHIRLQDIRLAYNFKNLSQSHCLVKNLEVSLYANNIGIIWKESKGQIDPDYINNKIPYSRSYAIGVRGSF